MAWTTPRTWVTGELVTAAQLNTHLRDNLNFLASIESAMVNQDVTGFTNTAYADLDALTTAPFASPVIVTLATGTSVLITIAAARHGHNTSGTGFVSVRVSGATTIASDDDFAFRAAAATGIRSNSYTFPLTTLTPGTNTFELQAKATAGNSDLSNPSLTVIPLA